MLVCPGETNTLFKVSGLPDYTSDGDLSRDWPGPEADARGRPRTAETGCVPVGARVGVSPRKMKATSSSLVKQ